MFLRCLRLVAGLEEPNASATREKRIVRLAGAARPAVNRSAMPCENINAELHMTMAQAWADVIAARTNQAAARLDRRASSCRA
jgi:hypothetical protein